MKNDVVEIGEQERAQLAGELGSFIYNFFLNQEPAPTVDGNRRAADKAAQVLGRVIAAASYPGKIDADYLMLSRRYEVIFGEAAREAADTVIKGWIRPVRTQGGRA